MNDFLKKSNVGFSLIEMIIVIAISVVLTTVLIGFSSQNRPIFSLSGERERLVSTLSEAKSLALQTFISDIATQKVCGYGVNFAVDLKSYVLFRDLPNPKSGNCLVNGIYTGDHTYDSNEVDELVRVVILPANMILESIPTENVFFEPPEPKVFFTPDPVGNEVIFNLKTTNDNFTFGIKITRTGQITKN